MPNAAPATGAAFFVRPGFDAPAESIFLTTGGIPTCSNLFSLKRFTFYLRHTRIAFRLRPTGKAATKRSKFNSKRYKTLRMADCGRIFPKFFGGANEAAVIHKRLILSHSPPEHHKCALHGVRHIRSGKTPPLSRAASRCSSRPGRLYLKSQSISRSCFFGPASSPISNDPSFNARMLSGLAGLSATQRPSESVWPTTSGSSRVML